MYQTDLLIKTLYIALVITTCASLNSASFTAWKSLYLPSHFLSVVISALFCECTHIQFCFFTRGEWLNYIHIINQKRIEKNNAPPDRFTNIYFSKSRNKSLLNHYHKTCCGKSPDQQFQISVVLTFF